MTTDTSATNRDDAPRWALIRELLVFQLKLLLDGFRDVVLGPLSLIVGIIDIVTVGEIQGSNFQKVLRFGRQSEERINLFGALDLVNPESEDREG